MSAAVASVLASAAKHSDPVRNSVSSISFKGFARQCIQGAENVYTLLTTSFIIRPRILSQVTRTTKAAVSAAAAGGEAGAQAWISAAKAKVHTLHGFLLNRVVRVAVLRIILQLASIWPRTMYPDTIDRGDWPKAGQAALTPPPASELTAPVPSARNPAAAKPDIEIVFGGAGINMLYQLGVMNAIRTQLPGCAFNKQHSRGNNSGTPKFESDPDRIMISGISGGGGSAMILAMCTNMREATMLERAFAWTDYGKARGARQLALGVYHCAYVLVSQICPTPEALAHLLRKVGIYVYNTGSRAIELQSQMPDLPALASSLMASTTIPYISASNFTQVALRRYGEQPPSKFDLGACVQHPRDAHAGKQDIMCHDPAMYDKDLVYAGLRASGRRVIFLTMDKEPEGGEPLVGAEDARLVTINCLSSDPAEGISTWSMEDYRRGDAWGRQHVVPKMRHALAQWGWVPLQSIAQS